MSDVEMLLLSASSTLREAADIVRGQDLTVLAPWIRQVATLVLVASDLADMAAGVDLAAPTVPVRAARFSYSDLLDEAHMPPLVTALAREIEQGALDGRRWEPLLAQGLAWQRVHDWATGVRPAPDRTRQRAREALAKRDTA